MLITWASYVQGGIPIISELMKNGTKISWMQNLAVKRCYSNLAAADSRLTVAPKFELKFSNVGTIRTEFPLASTLEIDSRPIRPKEDLHVVRRARLLLTHLFSLFFFVNLNGNGQLVTVLMKPGLDWLAVFRRQTPSPIALEEH